MNKFLRKLGFAYLAISKKMNHFREKVIQKDLEKEKRKFMANNRFEANENEVKEIKKEILLRKTLPLFLFLIISFMLFIIMVN